MKLAKVDKSQVKWISSIDINVKLRIKTTNFSTSIFNLKFVKHINFSIFLKENQLKHLLVQSSSHNSLPIDSNESKYIRKYFKLFFQNGCAPLCLPLFTFEKIIINCMWYLSFCHSNDGTSRGLSTMLACDWLSNCLFMSCMWIFHDVSGPTASDWSQHLLNAGTFF